MEIKRLIAKSCPERKDNSVGDGGGCGGGADNCPAVYETSTGDFIFQGTCLPSNFRSDLGVPTNETIGLIPRSLMQELVRVFQNDGK